MAKPLPPFFALGRAARRAPVLALTAALAAAGLATAPAVMAGPLERAQEAQARGDLRAAQIELRNAVRAEPNSGAARAALAAAAFRGGFGEGSTVHVDWHLIDVDALDAASSPVALVDGQPMVRWSATGGLMPLERYLDERIGLLQHPPERA